MKDIEKEIEFHNDRIEAEAGQQYISLINILMLRKHT